MSRYPPGKRCKTDKLFADTNLLIYMHDSRETLKRAVALRWFGMLLDRESLVVNVQVLNEFYVVALRRFTDLPLLEIRAFVDDLRPICTSPFGLTVVDSARQVQDASNYGWYDCLIVASAIDGGCRYLVTEDLDHGRSFGPLTIVNPFRVEPSSVLHVT